MDKCKVHPYMKLKCLGGHSAHPNNWYCPMCDASDQEVIDDYNHRFTKGGAKLEATTFQIHDEIIRRMGITDVKKLG